MYKSEKGITFMVLVITVIVLILIGTVAAGSAISTYRDAKVKAFIEELDLIKEKLILYEEKAKLTAPKGTDPLAEIGSPVDGGEPLKVLEKLERASDNQKLSSVESSGDKFRNYRYLTHADLVKYLEVADLDNEREVIIDIKTKEVYSISPIEYGKKLYYSADDIRNK